ncbi:hypothetical protein E5288_WYG009828 [Bos mutus]|uniref:Uncharacterized protein n=1 Tax=Bos mutus TaxID=72004 RepID=A0A6B0RQB2_9CETA|nr:hypothetical protein [Bos mutus]
MHPCFHRENDNLFFVISISLSKALTHYSVEVKTLDDCLLNIPASNTVHPKGYKKVPVEKPWQICGHFLGHQKEGFYPCGETTGRYSPNLMEFPEDLGWPRQSEKTKPSLLQWFPRHFLLSDCGRGLCGVLTKADDLGSQNLPHVLLKAQNGDPTGLWSSTGSSPNVASQRSRLRGSPLRER